MSSNSFQVLYPQLYALGSNRYHELIQAALTGLLANPHYNDPAPRVQFSYDEIAEEAVRYADSVAQVTNPSGRRCND